MTPQQSSKHPKHYASKFRAYLTANLALVSGVNTPIPFDVVQFDTLGEFDILVNNGFIPLQTGYYFISIWAHIQSCTAGTWIQLMPLINGGTVGDRITEALNLLPEATAYHGLYYLQQADIFTCTIRHNSVGNRNLIAGLFNTCFSGFRVG